MLDRRRPPAMGRAGRRGARRENHERHARRERPRPRLTARSPARRGPAGAGRASREAQAAGRVPLHRQGQCALDRQSRHHHGQGRLRHRRPRSTAWSTRSSRARRSTAARCKSFDAAEALKVPGVVKVVAIEPPPPPSEFQPLGGIAVIAKNTWAAHQGPRRSSRSPGTTARTPCYDSDTYRVALAEAARKPGKVVRNKGDVDAALAGRRRSACRRNTTSRTWRNRRWSRRPRPCACQRQGCEVLGLHADAAGDADRMAERLGLPIDEVTVQRDAARRRLRPQVEARLRGRGRAPARKAMDGAPVKVTWTREDDLQHGYYHTVVGGTPRGRARRAAASRSAWLHRTAAPTIGSIFAPDAKHELPFELGMGARQHARSRSRTSGSRTRKRPRTPGSAGSARCRTSRTPSRSSPSSTSWRARPGRDPEGVPARADRTAAAHRSAAIGDAWNHGEDPKLYPIDTGRLRARHRDRRRARPAGGRKMPKGRGLGIAAHHSFVSYVAVGRRGRGWRQRASSRSRASTSPSTAGRGQSGAGALADGRRGGAWASAWRPRARSRFKNGRVEQNNFDSYELTRIDAAPPEIRVHLIPTSVRQAPRRRRRAGRAAGRAGARERDLRGDRQAHPRLPIRDQLAGKV